ncbi:putative membrane protein [Neorhizobium sp. 2083]|uniref:cytochrome c oxidase assembly protein n=1 Tax=Neorhizobium sp. 2083 TaxID=2817762 RepID=UPI0028622264|nr:cytochrome c oxidase assembly protein [Neorhizobium sp. 2083]MDR6821117.1 putative membrane protein [Neorhizobium sp. 2083]
MSLPTEPYCGAAPTPDRLLAAWNFDPVLLCALAGLTFALWLTDSLRRSPIRIGVLMLLLVTAFVSPLCNLTSALFSARSLHHIVLTSIAAPIAASLIPWRWPPLAGLSFFAHLIILWLWHLPAPYAWAMSGSLPYWSMEIPLLASALWLWRDILDQDLPGLSLGVTAGTILQMAVLGAFVTFAPRPLYQVHFLTTEAFGLSALEDQQYAGLLMWVPASVPYVAVFLYQIMILLQRASHKAVSIKL